MELIKETCCHDGALSCPFCKNPPKILYYPTLTIIECCECGLKKHGHGAMSDKQTKEGICYLDIFNKWNNQILKLKENK